MKTQEFFKDGSIFNGWLEFNTPSGMMRAENKGVHLNGKTAWAVYVQEGNSFLHRANVFLRGKKDLSRRIFEEYELGL